VVDVVVLQFVRALIELHECSCKLLLLREPEVNEMPFSMPVLVGNVLSHIRIAIAIQVRVGVGS
jgi:hypothetical protein